MKQLAAALLFSAALSGCAANWQYVNQREEIKGPLRVYTAVIAAGWVRAPTKSDALVITRDGLVLQQIGVELISLEKAFTKSKREAANDWVPLELAELQVAELKASRPEMQTLDVLELKPSQVDGKPAFKLRTRYFNTWGLEITRVTYGLIHEAKFLMVNYEAPSLHYYRMYEPVFDEFLRELKLREKCRIFCG